MVDIGPGTDIMNGYKCAVCDYSTTERAEIDAHIRSEEHVKNVQEFHNDVSNNVLRENGKFFPTLFHSQHPSEQELTQNFCLFQDHIIPQMISTKDPPSMRN